MAHPSWFTSGQPHVWLPYTQMKTASAALPLVGAKGARLMLADGRELVDGTASWWCAAHGYQHPHIVDAVTRQAATLSHVMLGGLAHEQPYRLAARLAEQLPGDLNHVFFSESGSVSVEIAMKMAVQFHLNRGGGGRYQPGLSRATDGAERTRFLSFTGGYHGDTFATMSVCDPEEGMHTMFGGVVPEQIVVPLPQTTDTQAAFCQTLDEHGDTIAAVIVEPMVQGAGGMLFHDADVLRVLRHETERRGILLIFDEIFVGFGRLGHSMFACEAAGVVPDIITVSKALSGGTLPLAATVARDHVFEAFLDDDPEKALMHGPTYMGNALACAAANASLDLFETEPRLVQCQGIERMLSERLASLANLPGVLDVRCRGGIGVVQLASDVPMAGLGSAFVDAGVFIRPFRDVVYVTPPLNIPDDDLDILATALTTVLPAWLERHVKLNRALA
ncbi:MAG: adenosylmethionine--8-amino-7-oxononanoate transaminase [Pseudomonadota bacterium]